MVKRYDQSGNRLGQSEQENLALLIEGLSVPSTSLMNRSTPILNRLSFTLKSGARVAIIGPNGAGKSTLFSTILGLIPATYQRFEINGWPLSSLGRRQLSQQIAYIPQQNQIDPNLSVALWCEMARFPHQRWGFRLSQEEDQLIDWALTLTEALPFKERRLSELSGGERQRVYIAAALIQETPIIALDEPDNFLDPRYRQRMNRLILDLATSLNKTLLYVTHDLNLLQSGFTHILALKEGEIALFGEVEEVLTLDNLTTLYEYPFEVAYRTDGKEIYY